MKHALFFLCFIVTIWGLPLHAQNIDQIKVIGQGVTPQAAIDNAYRRAMQAVLTEYFKAGIRARVMEAVTKEIINKAPDYIFLRRILEIRHNINGFKIEMLLGVARERIRAVLAQPAFPGFGGQTVAIELQSAPPTSPIIARLLKPALKRIGQRLRAFWVTKGFQVRLSHQPVPLQTPNVQLIIRVHLKLEVQGPQVIPRLNMQVYVGMIGWELVQYDEGGLRCAFPLPTALSEAHFDPDDCFRDAGQEIYYRLCRYLEKMYNRGIFLVSFRHYSSRVVSQLLQVLAKQALGIKTCRFIHSPAQIPILEIHCGRNSLTPDLIVDKLLQKITQQCPTCVWRVGGFIHFKR